MRRNAVAKTLRAAMSADGAFGASRFNHVLPEETVTMTMSASPAMGSAK